MREIGYITTSDVPKILGSIGKIDFKVQVVVQRIVGAKPFTHTTIRCNLEDDSKVVTWLEGLSIRLWKD